MKMNFLYFLCGIGLFSFTYGYQQSRITPMCPNTSKIKPFKFNSANKGTPILNNMKSQKRNIVPKYNLQPLKIKLNIAKSESTFHIPTESEIQVRQSIAELDQWFHDQFPALFPKYINCQTLTWYECVWQESCSWCKWPTEGCQYTDVSYLLPTEERCVEGGFPYELDSLPDCIVNNEWNPAQWQACY